MESTEDRVKEIIDEQFGLADVGLDKRLQEDLLADNLDCVKIVMEDEFDIQITDEEAEQWKTVRDIVTFVESRNRRAGRGAR
jgi:acyl carrier protein